nr:TPA_asm: oncoid [Corynactis coral adintovirus]
MWNIYIRGMFCSVELHDGFIEEGEVVCPMCDSCLQKCDSVVDESCCSDKELVDLDGSIVCKGCGQVDGEYYPVGYVDFYQDMYKMRRRSVYKRKYHIENVIACMQVEDRGLRVSRGDRERIFIVFEKIDRIRYRINNQKRMCSIRFVLMRLFSIMGIEHGFFPPKPRSSRTLNRYRDWWGGVYSLIGDDIEAVLRVENGFISNVV